MRNIIKSIFTTTPGHLILCLLFTLIVGPYLPKEAVSFFYTISSLFVEVLTFFLPILIFTYLVYALIGFGQNSHFYVIFLLIGIFCSNICALLMSYSVGSFFLPLFSFNTKALELNNSINALFHLNLPKWIGVEVVTLISFAVAAIMIFAPLPLSFKNKFSHYIGISHRYLTKGLLKIFVPILPFYVLGYMLKTSYDGVFLFLIINYLSVIILNACMIVLYITFLYFIASKLIKEKLSKVLFNMLPAGLTAFSTMSSAATLPVTLLCTEKNLKDKKYAELIIPSTVNTHVVGDNITVTITALGLLTFFGLDLPSIEHFLLYIVFFSIANLSCVGIPGGSIMIILPVIQKYLGLSPEIAGILSTIYILLDPLSTTGNVMGNGAFSIIFSRVLEKIKPITNRGSAR